MVNNGLEVNDNLDAKNMCSKLYFLKSFLTVSMILGETITIKCFQVG